MKKIMLTLMLLLSVVSGALAQNDAMYVYRNDGEFNAFFKDEIDSIIYSHFDLDSVYHADWKMQVVYTADSVYRIPLDVIDSVSFVVPQTIYAPKVRKLDDMMPYLLSANGMTLRFSGSMPQAMLPQKDDVLIYEHFENEHFPLGFAGRVSSLNGNEVSCDSVDFDDVYSQFVCFGDYVAMEDSVSESDATRYRVVPKRINGSLSSSISISGTVGTPSKLFLTLDGSLGVDVRVTFLYTPTTTPYFDFSFGPTFTASLTAGAKCDLSANVLEKKVQVLGVPIPDTPFYLYVKSGPIIEPKVVASLTTKTSARLGFRLGVKYQNYNWIPYANNTSKGFSTPEIDGSIDGSLFMGFSTEVGISSYGEILSLALEKKAGAKLSANFKTDLLNSDKYEELTKAKLDLGLEGTASVSARLKFSKFFKAQASLNLLSLGVNLNSWKFVPSFTEPTIENTGLTSATLAVTPLEDLLTPVSIGMGIYDEDEQLVDYAFYSQDYRVKKDWGVTSYSSTFCNLKTKTKYTVSPMVKWMGMELKASPKKDLELHAVSIAEFKVTNSSHSKCEYFNDGRTYDYKYEASTTVEIESLDGVADWGYVYKDPYGNIKRISLMGFGTSYTDTRFAYYRNEAKSTACLYGYVKYIGDDKYYENQPHDYPLMCSFLSCPDNNHPHAIDLGLPSGTKWCCMNVGASLPEQYGGYYAWGETWEKSVYDEVTYTYFTGQDTNEDGVIDKNFSVVNIGYDIAGTSYDVAHVSMGGAWQMPSPEQSIELGNSCFKIWTQQNGVNGYLVTGKNGGQLFFPATGIRVNSALYDDGLVGYYWLSLGTDFDYYRKDAHSIYFKSGYQRWYGSTLYRRYYGYTVRAVCP